MNANQLEILKAQSLEELEDFIILPHQIYQDDLNWPGQDDQGLWDFLSSAEHAERKALTIQPFIAKRGEVVVGRICGIICPAFNVRWQKQTAYFGYFEAISDQEVANQLFAAVQAWANHQHCDELWGPLSPTTSGQVGFLINQFAERPTYGYPYNPAYYQELCTNYGFEKEKDLYELSCSVSQFFKATEELQKEVNHLKNDPDYQIRFIDEDQLEQDFAKIVELHPKCFGNHWGYRKIEMEEFNDFLSKYLHSVAGQRLLFIVEHQDRPVGFCIVHLDKNEISPEAKLPKKINISVIGVDHAYHRRKIGQWIYLELAHWMKEYHFSRVNAGWIEEQNLASANVMRKFGSVIDKTYRVFSLKFR